MRFAVARFPGSNCDEDCYFVLKEILKQETIYLWHEEKDLKNVGCIVLPGGFSYGDYLRTGAIARFSPIMREVKKFAGNGGLVLGICNGFQILLEAGLLEGAMLLNLNQTFICKDAYLRIENNHTPFTNQCENKQILKFPIAHGDGRFYASAGVLKKLNQNNQIILRYSSPQGETNSLYNPNGSLENIAGICNLKRNVFGLMPHPERAGEKILGSTDGILIFQSILSYLLKN